MFVLLIVALCVRWGLGDHRYDCEEDYCSKSAPCVHIECPKGYTLLRNATRCGCCHLCTKQLEEDTACQTQVVGVLPNEECGPTLVCKDKTCQRVDTICVKNGHEHCDEFGFYKPVLCVQDLLCFCVDKNGSRIFGTDIIANKKDMHCDCSGDILKFPRTVDEGMFPRCLSNGNYDPFQCTEEWCYCMGSSHAPTVPADGHLEDLPCYDKRRHLSSGCWRERALLWRKLREFKARRITVIGVDFPVCDPDGSYSPLQCTGDSCFCVDASGEEYKDTRFPRHSKNQTVNCNCLRDQDLLELTDQRKNYIC